MKSILSILTGLCFLMVNTLVFGQYDYEPSDLDPFGKPHPEAPQGIMDFQPLIGESTCQSVTRNQDGTWADSIQMLWRFKYIMNGWAVQDETLKADGRHSGSIRQFNQDSAKWYVHYYASAGPSPTLSSWEGSKNDEGNIVLYREQKAPNGMDGFYRLTFSNISNTHFDWAGEWVNTDESIVYPTWRIYCKKD